jgi:shikimate kinase
MPPPKRIVLVGMMGSGKTTVGRLLAERLGRAYLDNDDLVRELAGREPARVAADDGEHALHVLEAAALLHALGSDDAAVVSAAAWVVLDPACRAALTAEPGVVYLRAQPETLLARIGSGHGRRPDATDQRWLAHRALERDSEYRSLARLTIDVDADAPTDIAAIIVGELEGTAPGTNPRAGAERGT